MKFRFEIKLILIFIFAIIISTSITSFLNGRIIQENFTQFCNNYNQELPRCLRDEAGQTFLKSVEKASLISGTIALLASVFLSIIVTRLLLKPIRHIINASRKFAEGNYQERINLKTNDEFNELIQEINNLFKKVENQAQLRKDLVANFSHEIATPLTSLYGYIEAFEDNVIDSKKKRQKILKIMKSEIDQVVKLAQETRELALLESDDLKLNFKKVDLENLIDEIILILKPIALKNKIEIEKNIFNKAKIKADELKLKQALINIIHNAIIYSKPEKKVIVSLMGSSETTQIKIKDSGFGIKKENIKNIFEKFYRGSEVREKRSGSGIGLAIAKKIINLHGGTIKVESHLGRGSTFFIHILKNK